MKSAIHPTHLKVWNASKAATFICKCVFVDTQLELDRAEVLAALRQDMEAGSPVPTAEECKAITMGGDEDGPEWLKDAEWLADAYPNLDAYLTSTVGTSGY